VAKLGSFGAAAREIDPGSERDTFDFFGEEFTVLGTIPPMLMLRLGAYMAGELGLIESNAAVYKALRCALTPPDAGPADGEQFDRFEQLAVAKQCDVNELLRLVFSLVGIQIDFPTEPQPTSPDGLPDTSANLNSSASDSPDSPRLRSVDEVLGG
jgi:hypothetical protein